MLSFLKTGILLMPFQPLNRDLKGLNRLFNILMEEEIRFSPTLSDIPAVLEFQFMNPLELQALLSQLEPLGKKKVLAQQILRILS